MLTATTTDEVRQVRATIDGRKYNTDAATLLAVAEYRGERNEKLRDALYVTRRGLFFETSDATFDDATRSWRKGAEHIRALTPSEADKWLTRKGGERTEHYARYLGQLPEEQAAEEVSMIVRLPLGLKAKVERKARAQGIAVNEFLINVLERAIK